MNSRRVQYYGFEANGVEVQAPKGWNSDHENKIREILCNGPSAKIYTLEIYPLYGIHNAYDRHVILLQAFDTVIALVEFHKKEPLHLKSGGDSVLKFECPR